MHAEREREQRESMQKSAKMKNQEVASRTIRHLIFESCASKGALYMGLVHVLLVFPLYIITMTGVVSNPLSVVCALMVYVMVLCFIVPLIHFGYLAHDRVQAA